MPYVYYNKITGTAQDFQLIQQTGRKCVPFVKKELSDQAYDRSSYIYTGGNTHTLPGGMSMRAGGGYANEVQPTRDFFGSVADNSFTFSSDGNRAYNRAYAKFKAKCYTQADTLTALVERRKTIKMVSKRLQQLQKGAALLKRGKFREFLKTFGVKALKKHQDKLWSRPSEFGSLWLEYWMGWAPTVGDVNNALEFLGQPIPNIPVRAGSRVERTEESVRSQKGSTFSNNWSGHVTVNIKASIVVTNFNLFTLQGVGLLNPVATAWKTTPFSWFFDWFSNIAKVLEQLTDWVGIQLVGLNVSVKTELTGSWIVGNAQGYFNWFPCPSTLYRTRNVVFFTRKTGGALPTLRPLLQLPSGLSISRGATAVSLLITMFAPKTR